ncbi:MAG TPA: diphthamide biosynthesis enzyme Dph2 [Thermoplasmata archaeon]|nr:diphthamide biosynthesis enzyme Dph2 [Thermoplasmata archaeon]
MQHGRPKAIDPGAAALLDLPGPPLPGGPPAIVVPRFDAQLFEAVRKGRHTKLALQVPAGLVRNANDRARELSEATGLPVSVVVRACFGACDFPSPSEVAGADALVLLGHSPILNVPRALPTYFVEMRSPSTDVEALAALVLDGDLPRRLGLVASVQHLDLVAPLSAALARRGVELRTGTGDRRLSYPAQALGCNYTGAESIRGAVDGYLFLGTGQFHPIGLALSVEAPVWSLDPMQRRLEPPIDRAAIVRRRQLTVARAMDARRFGILVSTFAGQHRGAMASALVERARRHGKSAEIHLFDRLDPRDLEGRDLDAYVNTACPRIALDDAELYPRPMLTPPEFLMALGELPLEPYRFDTYH